MKKFIISPDDKILIGKNLPHKSIQDGDFEDIISHWRKYEQSPCWKATVIKGNGVKPGLNISKIQSGGNEIVTFHTKELYHKDINNLNENDILNWQFSAQTEYQCDGFVSLSLVFENTEIILANKIKIANAPEPFQVYSGTFRITKEYAVLIKNQMPFVKLTLESNYKINVYIDWIDLYLSNNKNELWKVSGNTNDDGILITWKNNYKCDVYRSDYERKNFELIGKNISEKQFLDTNIINGKTYFYIVSISDDITKTSSQQISIRKIDTAISIPPKNFIAIGNDWTISLQWDCDDGDIDYYNIFRKNVTNNNMAIIASGIKTTCYTDTLPIKNIENIYQVQSVDFSGNKSELSDIACAKVNAILGSSFSDLILPLPITDSIKSDGIWGDTSCLPRDINNGIEDNTWSYWCGVPVKGKDNKYHMTVSRWPENSRQGHWAWPFSTVASTVSDNALGPYKVERELAYDYANGMGHNPTIIYMNDGSYLLYTLVNHKMSLVDFMPSIFSSKSPAGPWKYKGDMFFDIDLKKYPPNMLFAISNNLSGIQEPDGSMVFVTRNGATIKSDSGILGPYRVLNDEIKTNKTLPFEYQKFVYEDPFFWKDEVQYHMIINAFLNFTAMYFRSPDGINWYYQTGFAYTPLSTVYENEVRNLWHKMERPAVLLDERKRASHLALAVIDWAKEKDYGNDNHSSKNQILPLVVQKHLTKLNSEKISENSKKIEILVHKELDFDPTDIDLNNIFFGAAKEVDFGRGGKLIEHFIHKDGLVLVFDGNGTGLNGSEENFAAKLISYTKTDKKLIIGYVSV
ncbi:MAG: hypothetical protein R3Y33_03215 [Clostridia bacterium]